MGGRGIGYPYTTDKYLQKRPHPSMGTVGNTNAMHGVEQGVASRHSGGHLGRPPFHLVSSCDIQQGVD